jgi:hypothetical protein
MDHRWWCHHAGQIQIHTEDGVVYNADPQWLVCMDCNEMIERHDWFALARRAAETHPDRKKIHKSDLGMLIKACFTLNKAFAGSWERSHALHEEGDCLVRLPQVH